jgi:hypothetical protein
MKKSKYQALKWLIIPFLALMVFVTIQLFIRNPMIVEHYYSQKLYPFLASFISSFSMRVPFSLDDVFYFLLILGAILIVILIIVRKISIKTSGLLVLNVLAAGYVFFYVLWGFNYFRADLNSRIDLESGIADEEHFMMVFGDLAEATNKSYTRFDDFNEEEVARLIEDSYRQLATVLKLKYPGGSRRAKPITLSGFFAQAGISGYFGPFFNEVHLNSNLLPVEYPFVLAHEKAHQFGITGESEANFYAWLVCTGSNSSQLRYSANLVALRYFMHYGYRQEGYKEVVSRIDERVIDDIRKMQQHWIQLRNEKVENVAAKMNDAYLKSNQVEKGINDYTGIVKHILDFSLDTAFQEKAGY